MTETIEEAGGFDRRSLIKKGLVIGGAATVLPVISTFNAPAFAASPPAPTFRVHYNITLGLALGEVSVTLATRNAGGAPTCPAIAAAWTAAAADPGTPSIAIHAESLDLVNGSITFTLDPPSGYTFVNGVHGAAACDAPSSGLATNSVTFPLSLLSLELITQFWFVITPP